MKKAIVAFDRWKNAIDAGFLIKTETYERRCEAMQKLNAWKNVCLFVCIFLIIISGCKAQTVKGMRDLYGSAPSQVVLQIPTKVHTECPNMLDEGQWLANDDAVSLISMHDKKSLLAGRNGLSLFPIGILLAGPVALSAYVTARIYHRSSCPTRVLSRILSFILKADGQKDNISFLLL